MLQRVIQISNVGRFRNSAATPNPPFARQTMVFAPNGYGKTTLCAILRSLERGQSHHLTGRRTLGVQVDPTVSLLWSGAQKNFRNDAWPASEPLLSIFDGTFVAENVHSGEMVEVANRRNLYRIVVGRNGVGLAEQELALAAEGRTIQAGLGPAERAVTAIAGGLTARAFDVLPTDVDLATKLVVARVDLAALSDAVAIRDRAALAEAPVPAWDDTLATMLRKSLDGIGAEVEDLVAGHIRDHGMQEGGEGWLAAGTRFAEGDDCPFCGRDGLEGLDLIRAYRALFGDAYAGLRAEADAAAQVGVQHFGAAAAAALRTLEARNIATLEFWARHSTVGDRELGALGAAADAMAGVAAAYAALVAAKAARPLEAIGSEPELAALKADIEAISLALETYNEAVRDVNLTIAAKKEQTAAGSAAAVQAEIARLETIARRHSPAGVATCDEWRRLDAEKRRVNTAKAAVRTDLEAHCAQVVQPYAGRINHFLKLFNAGFTIAQVGHAYPGGVATCNYVLEINNVEVPLGDGNTAEGEPSFKNTLSAGDRTTLALAFFLAGLEREPDIADRVVVFDDPFNSQDGFRRRQTVHEIMAVARRGAQVIVLSHDPAFLKGIWTKCQPADRAAMQLLFHESTGTKIMPFDLDDACRGRAAAELDDLQAFRSNGAGNLREIIKKLRIVLETHFRTAFTGCYLGTDNLGEIIRKTREGGLAHPAAGQLEEMERINDYTADYHHGEDPRGELEPPLDRDELNGFVTQTLTIANALPA